MSLSKKIKIKPEIISEALDGEEVILNLSNQTYFGLDPTGTRIWECIKQGCSIEEMERKLLDEYDVSPRQLHTSLAKLISDLKRNDLIEHI